MRLFTAVEIDEEARAALAAEQERLLSKLTSGAWRFVRPEHLHLTLVFLGEVDEARGAQLVEAMSQEISHAPFSVAFGRLGAFPAHGAPRVLWVGVIDGASQLQALHALVAARLESPPTATRPFDPHLTLARSRGGRSGLRGVLSSETARVIATVRVEAVTLLHSRLSSAGPAYTRLAVARLRRP